MSIVCLVPEAHGILAALGLDGEIVGLPEETRLLSRGVASSAALADALGTIHPRLIFTSETAAAGGVPQSEVRRLVRRLRPRPGVYALEPHTLGDILSDIKTVGDATGQQRSARRLIESLRVRIDAVTLCSAHLLAERPAPRVAVLASAEPPTAAGWWLAELIGLAGGHDVLAGLGRPPRVVSLEEIQAARPDVVLTMADLLPAPRGLPDAASAPVDLLESLAARLADLSTIG